MSTIQTPAPTNLTSQSDLQRAVLPMPGALPEGDAFRQLNHLIDSVEKQLLVSTGPDALPPNLQPVMRAAVDNASVAIVDFKQGDKEDGLLAAYSTLTAALRGVAMQINASDPKLMELGGAPVLTDDERQAQNVAAAHAPTNFQVEAVGDVMSELPESEQLVTVYVPKEFKLTITGGGKGPRIVTIPAGVQDVSREIAEHDYAARNGLKPYIPKQSFVRPAQPGDAVGKIAK